MRKICCFSIILLLLSLAGPVMAQDIFKDAKNIAVTDEAANGYFNDCLARPDPLLNNDQQQAMCACMAANLQQFMTMAEFKAVNTAQASPMAEEAWDKTLLYVFGPCMEFPAKVMAEDNCHTNNRLLKPVVDDMDSVCKCVADDMQKYVSLNGPDLIADHMYQSRAMKIDKKIVDPLDPILKHPDFRKKERKSLGACLAKYDEEKNEKLRKKYR